MTLESRCIADRLLGGAAVCRGALRPQVSQGDLPYPRSESMRRSVNLALVVTMLALACKPPSPPSDLPTTDAAPASDVAPTADDELVAEAGRIIEEHVAKGLFSGVVVLAHDGKPLLVRAEGLADRERGLANAPETRFDIASLGKMLTSVAIAQHVLARAGMRDVVFRRDDAQGVPIAIGYSRTSPEAPWTPNTAVVPGVAGPHGGALHHGALRGGLAVRLRRARVRPRPPRRPQRRRHGGIGRRVHLLGERVHDRRAVELRPDRVTRGRRRSPPPDRAAVRVTANPRVRAGVQPAADMTTSKRIGLGAAAAALLLLGVAMTQRSSFEAAPPREAPAQAMERAPGPDARARPPAPVRAERPRDAWQAKRDRILELRRQRSTLERRSAVEDDARAEAERCSEECWGTLELQLRLADVIEGCRELLPAEARGTARFDANVIAEPGIGAVVESVDVRSRGLGCVRAVVRGAGDRSLRGEDRRVSLGLAARAKKV